MYNESIMNLKKQIADEIVIVLENMGVKDVQPQIEYPADPRHGDYSTNIAMALFGNRELSSKISHSAKASGDKKDFKSPMELAEQLAAEFKVQSSKFRIFEKIEVVKPGFINFSLSSEFLVQKLQKRLLEDKNLETREKKGKVVVEYSSPNIAKPFTIGHLRSSVIGDAVANLLSEVGYEVFRDNHVGDWGTQFGKQIYAIKAWGDEAKIEESERPVKMLVDLYVRFHSEAEKNPELEDRAREWFKKLEDGDSEARRLWQKCIEWSWKEFDKIYELINIPSQEGAGFENNGRGYGESFFEGKMKPVIEELEEKKLLKTGKEGAKIVEFDEASKLPPLMIIKKDGATLYSTRDLATDKFRIEKYGKEVLIINEVGSEQALYFQQLYELERMLGWFSKEQRVHLKHGLIRFRDGKMSTRKGNTIWLEDVLGEAESRAWNLQKHKTEFEEHTATTRSEKLGEAAKKHVLGGGQRINVAQAVGIGAIKWNDLKRDAKQDIMFDWDEVLNMQGNSGPYVQYAFARAQSILAKVKSQKLKVKSDLKLEIEERELLRLLARFDEVVEEAATRFAPNILCTYLFELSQSFNLFYQKHQIIKAEGDSRDFRLFLTQKTGETIKKGLALLGIEAPSKM
jgi:arginyl-tRNA synthetase